MIASTLGNLSRFRLHIHFVLRRGVLDNIARFQLLRAFKPGSSRQDPQSVVIISYTFKNCKVFFNLYKLCSMNDKNPHREQMVKIPAGPFLMGSDDGPAEETPIHEVWMDEFLIDACPITNEQFKFFLKACPEWQKESGIKNYMNVYY